MTTNELKQRTKNFAVRVTRLVDALPNAVKKPRDHNPNHA